MEENRKGPGIFYAVVGVATLVVAIIGATFAYFSASAQDTTINGHTAASAELTLTVSRKTAAATINNMIPMQDDDLQKGVTGATGKSSCIDANGNTVCQVYEIKIENKSAAAVNVNGTLNLDAGGATNMRWRLLDSESTISATAPIVQPGTAGAIDTQKNLAANNGTATYYVAVWLHETGSAQDTPDAGKTFNGTVSFNAVDTAGNVSGITANFGA